MKELLAKIKAALEQKDGGEEAATALLTAHEAGLNKSRDDALTEAKQAKAKLKAYADIDPDEYKSQKDKIEELEQALKDKPDVEKEVKRVQEKHVKELDKVAKSLATEKAAVHRLTVEAGLTSALAFAGVTADAMPYVRAHFVPQAVVEESGEERIAKIGEKPLADAVATWAKTPEAKLFIRAAPSSGGGANGGSGNTTAGKKTMGREDFFALGAAERMSFVKEGGTLVDKAG